MPQAPIDHKGTVLFYTDSGPVQNSTDYTTLVIYHGSAFTGREYHRSIFARQSVNSIQIPSTSFYHLEPRTTSGLS